MSRQTGDGHGGLGLSYEEAMAIQKAKALLADAAPDLLETARDFASMPCETLGVEDLEGGCCRTCRARRAIAKAEGRS